MRLKAGKSWPQVNMPFIASQYQTIEQKHDKDTSSYNLCRYNLESSFSARFLGFTTFLVAKASDMSKSFSCTIHLLLMFLVEQGNRFTMYQVN